jgi:predicted metal-dependent phosphoesterase TrpH
MQTAPAFARRYVDLHIHTIHSDGSGTVKEVLETAARKGLAAVAITDHDCIDAYPEALERGAEVGMEPTFISSAISSTSTTRRSSGG